MPVAVPLIAAGVGAAGTIAASNAQSNAAKSAANASQKATDASIAEQRRQFDLARQDQQPWLTTGASALGRLASLYGLQTAQSPATFDEASYLQANPDVAAAIAGGAFGGSALD